MNNNSNQPCQFCKPGINRLGSDTFHYDIRTDIPTADDDFTKRSSLNRRPVGKSLWVEIIDEREDELEGGIYHDNVVLATSCGEGDEDCQDEGLLVQFPIAYCPFCGRKF